MTAPLPLLAVLWDQLLGEPPARLHPVVWIGSAIDIAYRRAPEQGRRQQWWFGFMASALLLACAIAAGMLIQRIRPTWLWGLLELFLVSSCFAQRALTRAALVVKAALDRGDIASAREHMSWLCSRDPTKLEPDALCAATVSSVAENASDSVVAPLFWYALLGLPALLAYRVINTLDAMVGYHGHLEYLGRVPARLDDVANFIPARVTALLLLIAGALRGLPVLSGLRMWRRDGRLTESPNAGIPMATMAGLLSVQLGKPGHYRLGDADRALAPAQIAQAVGLLRSVTVMSALLASCLRLGITGAWP